MTTERTALEARQGETNGADTHNERINIMGMKQAYIDTIQARLNEWDAQVEKLTAQADEASADAKTRYEKQINDLKEHQKEAQLKLDDMRKSGEDAWKDLKVGVEDAWKRLEKGVVDATSRFAA